MSPPQPTRRNGASPHNPPRSAPSTTTTTTRTSNDPSPTTTIKTTTTSTLLPLTPTTPETLLLTLYPTLLLLGSLYSHLSPTTRNTPYNPLTQSHPPHLAPSYFAKKSNLLNTYFVKIAWLYVSLAYLLFLFLHPSTGPPRSLILTPKRLRGLLRYALVTAWWGVVTQWFLGPGLIDRVFGITGGGCEGIGEVGVGVGTASVCRAGGGVWRGGHDISGHVFILVLGSGFLGMEVLGVFGRGGKGEERVVRRRDGGVGRVEGEGEEVEGGMEKEAMAGLWAVVGVVGISWWMLLMTAAFFHVWFEKLTGLLVAFVGIFVVYYLPRALPDMRDVIGMPGI